MRIPPHAAAQPGIAADRFAREIVAILKLSPSALAATECQPVGPKASCTRNEPLTLVTLHLRSMYTRTMTSNSHSSDISTLSTDIAQAFDIAGELHVLPGGEGRTYRAGNIIYRRETNVAEASYLADVYHHLPEIGFRIPKPIRTRYDEWVSLTGWSAWTFVTGRLATQDDVLVVIPAIRAFHHALASQPYPAHLATRDTPYDRADQAAWDTPPDTIDPRLLPVVKQLLHLRQPIDSLPTQLIHGDLNEENILIEAGIPPAIIDFTPYWRPPEFALAVLAYWLGSYQGDMAILRAFAQVREFDQMLVRSALRMILISHEFSKQGGSLEHAVEEFQTPVRIIAEWINQRERL